VSVDPGRPPRFELGTDGPTVVLTGVDGSRTSLRAAAWAAGLARRQGARLVVVHVVSGAGVASLAPQGAGALTSTRQELAADLERQAHEGAALAGIELEFLVATGDPFSELVRVAEQVRAEVVVAARRRPRVTGWWARSRCDSCGRPGGP